MATTFGLRVLPDELVAVQNKMEGYARDYGLDFFPTIFELVDNERLHALASFGGFPTRFPHWRFGMEYERLAKGYQYGLSNEESGNYVIESRRFEQVKAQLLFQLTNRGRPLIYVQDGNYDNRGELLLDHRYAGPELKTDQAVDTLASLYRLWGRPVMIESVLEEKVVLLTYDGKKHGLEPSPKSLEQKTKEGVQPWS